MRFFIVCVFLLLPAVIAGASVAPTEPTVDAPSVVDADRQRIRAHLARVERELRAADVSHLTADRRTARLESLDRLRSYRLRGEFPHNHDFAGRTPYFRDHRGVLCAMAYLIAESGATELVDRVARTANNAYVPDLASDPELLTWLEANGMTAAEAARVQPAYQGPSERHNLLERVQADYLLWGGVTLAADAVAIAVNRSVPPDDALARGLLGVTVGTVGIVFSVAGLATGESLPQALGIANLAAGWVTVALGTRSIMRADDPPAGPAVGDDSGTRLRLDVGPRLVDRRPGVGLALRF